MTSVTHIAPSATDVAPRELTEFAAAARNLDPRGLTACLGQTVHHLLAHMVGSYDEATRHILAYADGRPIYRTRTFEEREPAWRALPTAELIEQLETQEERMRSAVADVIGADPDATLLWVNRQVRVVGFLTHLRMECALHRWDLVGDDAVGDELLSADWITKHTVEFVGAAPLTSRGLAVQDGAGRPLRTRLRSPGTADVVIDVDRSGATLGIEPQGGVASVTGDAAARLLLLWGRKAMPPGRLTLTSDVESLERVELLFCGY